MSKALVRVRAAVSNGLSQAVGSEIFPSIFLWILPWILETLIISLSHLHLPVITGTFIFSTSLKLPEYFHAPSRHSCEEPWAEVSCRVDWIATVQTHGHPDGHDDQADAQRLHAFWSANILPVSDSQDAQDQCGSCNYLENKSIRQLA